MSMRNTLVLLAAGWLPLVSACGGGGGSEAPAPAPTSAPASAAPAATSGTGSVSGKVAFEGTPSTPEKVKLSADPKCAAMQKDGLEKTTIKVTDGGLSEALVYVKSGASGTYPAPTEAAVLD